MDDVHELEPLLLILPRHAHITLVGDVVKGLLKKVKVDAVALFLTDQEVTLLESGADGGNIHGTRTQH